MSSLADEIRASLYPLRSDLSISDRMMMYFAGRIISTGAPEGVTTANIGSEYINLTTGDLYLKKTGTGNTGWILVSDASVAGIPLSYLDTDGTFAANSDSKVASQKAVLTYLKANVAPMPTALQSGNYYRLPNATLQTSAALGVGNFRTVKKYIPPGTTLIRIGLEVTAIGDVGSHLRIGIHNDVGGKAGTLLLDCGVVAGDSATVQEITINQAFVSGGWFHFGAVVQDVVTVQPTVRNVNIIMEPNVLSLGTSIPVAGATALGDVYTGATAALTASPSWGNPSSAAPSIFGKVQ